MKGVILTGGYGTRLMPMTRVANRRLPPVFDRPMGYFPIESLYAAGVAEGFDRDQQGQECNVGWGSEHPNVELTRMSGRADRPR